MTRTSYHIYRTYGRPLILRAEQDRVTGATNAGWDRRIDAIEPTALTYDAPGINQDYYDALITGETCHGAAHRIVHVTTERTEVAEP